MDLSPSVAESLAFEVVQFGISDNFNYGFFNVVSDPNKLDFVVLDNNVTGADVLIARLTDATDINDGFFLVGNGVNIIDFVSTVEVRVLKKDSRYVGVTDETDALESFEDGQQFGGIGVNIVWENILIDRFSRRAVDHQDIAHLQPDRQPAEKGPALLAFFLVRLVFQHLPGPITGPFSAGVEIGRLVKDSVVVVSHDADDLPFYDQIDALPWFRAVTDDIAKTEHLFDVLLIDILKYSLQGSVI